MLIHVLGWYHTYLNQLCGGRLDNTILQVAIGKAL